eukprot:5328638-Prymnesium_polylepis.1
MSHVMKSSSSFAPSTSVVKMIRSFVNILGMPTMPHSQSSSSSPSNASSSNSVRWRATEDRRRLEAVERQPRA